MNRAGHASDRNRTEITSLRQEISGLLQANGQLHQHLGQLNGLLSPAGDGLTEAAQRREVLNAAPPSWAEERKNLEARAAELSDHCRRLQSAASAPSRMQDDGPGPRPPGPPPPSAASLASLLRERDDLHQRLHATELARCAAEQRRSTTEAALARTLEELDRQRSTAASYIPAPAAGGGGSEAEGLRRQLAEAQAQLAELDLSLAARSERVRANEREYAEVRVEYDGLVAANEALRQELTTTRSRISEEQQGCRAAEQELHELQAKLRAGETEFGAEIEALNGRRRGLELTLRDATAAVAASESETAEARVESLGLQAQLEVLQAAKDEIIAQEHQASTHQREEVARLEAKAEELSAEAADLAEKHRQVKTSLQELQFANERRQQQGPRIRTAQETEEDLAAERGHAAAAERCRRAREEVAEAERRLAELLRRLGEERKQSLELARELAAAREAATATSSAGGSAAAAAAASCTRRSRSASSGPSSRRRSVSADRQAAPKRQQPSEHPGHEPGTSSGGWAADALKLQRELELLQRWKTDALAVMQQMQADVAISQEKYHKQLQQNQGLQTRLDQMGQQARDVMASLPLMPKFGGSPDELAAWPSHEAGGKEAAAATGNFTSKLLSPCLGPDMPERPDLPARPRAAELLPGAGGS